MLRDDATLLDIAEALQKMVLFVKGFTKASFLKDEKTQAAVLHEIAVLGEATKRLSEDFKKSHSDIRWKDISGMRDIIIHQYDRVNLDRVWDVARRDALDLLERITPLLPPEDGKSLS